jgi:hypothetical protein
MIPERVRCKGSIDALQANSTAAPCCDDDHEGPRQTRPLSSSTSYVSSDPFDEHHWTGNIHCVRDAMCWCERTDFNTRLVRATEPGLAPISSQPSSSPLPTRHLQPSQRYAPLGKLWMGTTAQAMHCTCGTLHALGKAKEIIIGIQHREVRRCDTKLSALAGVERRLEEGSVMIQGPRRQPEGRICTVT